MESSSGSRCVNCSKSSSANKGSLHFSKLTSKFKRMDISIQDGLFTVFGELVDPSRGVMCEGCVSLLRVAYINHVNCETNKSVFTSLTTTSSPVADFLAECRSVRTGQLTLAVAPFKKPPPPKIIKVPLPLAFQMLKGKEDKFRQKTFFGTIRRIVRAELVQLSKKSVLRREITQGDTSLSMQAINDEVLRYAPTVKCILDGMSPMKKGKSEMRVNAGKLAIVSIALNSTSHMCNRLQKIVGLGLWRTNASVKTFQDLSNLGISCTYSTLKNLLEQLREESNKETNGVYEAKGHGETTPETENGSHPMEPEQPLASDNVTKEIGTIGRHLEAHSSTKPKTVPVMQSQSNKSNQLSFTFDGIEELIRAYSTTRNPKARLLPTSSGDDPPRPIPISEKKHKCPVKGCNKSYFLPTYLQRHQIAHLKHNRSSTNTNSRIQKNYLCPQCKKGFKTNPNRLLHIKTAHGAPKKNFLCSNKSKSSSNQQQLRSTSKTQRKRGYKECGKELKKVKG